MHEVGTRTAMVRWTAKVATGGAPVSDRIGERMEDRDTELNEQRTIDEDRDDQGPSVIDAVEDAVTTFARPLADNRPDAEDAARQRELNDAEQRS